MDEPRWFTDEPGWFTTRSHAGEPTGSSEVVNRLTPLVVYLGMRQAQQSRRGTQAPSDEQLMTALHDAHAGALFAFALRYVDDRDHARDVVQETLLRAWRNLDKIDPEHTNPRAYLFTVARNLLTDQWRAAQHRPRLVNDDARSRPTRHLRSSTAPSRGGWSWPRCSG